ncbi:glucose-1-phosphate phosphodismutase beta-phosphoglucomutase domain protein [Mycobacterium xenopi 3993]|nr:glucose-1-phosphate phosphodismutase beta-phosphoglucomutase domain protein [Mycobacterium xenopi 3993]
MTLQEEHLAGKPARIPSCGPPNCSASRRKRLRCSRTPCPAWPPAARETSVMSWGSTGWAMRRTCAATVPTSSSPTSRNCCRERS